MSSGRRILGPATATLLVAAAGVLAAPTSPAASAPAASASVAVACSGAAGVTVIVDYNEIGGPTRAGCAPDAGGESAAEAFADAGFALEYHPRQPGYVCKVTGLPTDRPCLENDSFWSLWWSDGESGRWVFANQGVGGLSVPDGGYVSFAWHEGAGNAQPPDVVPTPRAEPEPTDDASTDDGRGDTGGNGDGGDGGNGGSGGDDEATTDDAGDGTTSEAATSATTSDATEAASGAAPSGKGRKPRDRASDKLTATATATDLPGAEEITDGPPTSDLATDTADDSSALPTWIGLGVAVVVLGAAAAVALLRRRAG